MDQIQLKPFWQQKSLTDMSPDEWESLCDGCGRCCLNKLEDIDTGEIHSTSVACFLLDIPSCRCTDYQNRRDRVSECVLVTPANVEELNWLPDTCAYRLLARGQSLPDWHPLISGDPESVLEAGISVRHLAISELNVEDMEDYILES
mgnify:CR=1 FL=1